MPFLFKIILIKTKINLMLIFKIFDICMICIDILSLIL
ncbi:hypothetical protein CJE0479 [Campylobacter jejuni RM1221]|nr:hypothetical protein CJE0479 [Campylobacter jejuni RM1221]